MILVAYYGWFILWEEEKWVEQDGTKIILKEFKKFFNLKEFNQLIISLI